MGVRQKLLYEIQAIVLTTAYFAAWFFLLMLVKELLLEEYNIRIAGFGVAIVAALVVGKVVLIPAPHPPPG